ncbi:MAG: hypothetical protein ACK523_11110, partial [Pirellulaceae bacterium]
MTTLGAQIGTDGRIKEGLALVDASGTVNVNNGTYSEWVDINKASVTLKAVSNWGPTIEGYAPTGETVRFTADNVTLQGFQINNQRASNPDGRAVAPRGTTGGAIKNNIFLNAFRGIQGQFYGEPKSLTITDNVFQPSVSYGVASTEGMSIAKITGNVFFTTVEGIGLGAGVSIAEPGSALDSQGIFTMLNSQTFTLATGYALKDYRDNTIYVKSGGPLQAAINGATAGDKVKVSAGTYATNLNITKQISLLGSNSGIAAGYNGGVRGPETIVNGAIDLTSTADGTVIDGFTITGGTQNGGGHHGVRVNGGANSVSVVNNILTGNGVLSNTQGVEVGSGGITGMVVRDNEISAFASGVYVNSGGVVEVLGNKIHNVFAGVGNDSNTLT